MLKKTFIALALPLLSLLAIGVATPPWGVSAQPASQTARHSEQAPPWLQLPGPARSKR
jgi:hypothetical protein